MDAYERCLSNKRLRAVDPDEIAAAEELRTALQELRTAIHDFEAEHWAGAVTNAYFSMLHACQGAIHVKGLRSTNLYSLIEALRHHFLGDETVTEEELRVLQNAKEAHEMAQSGARVTSASALEYLEAASNVLYNILATLDIPALDAELVPRISS